MKIRTRLERALHFVIHKKVARKPYQDLYVFKFLGGAIQFWDDTCCNSDHEFTLLLLWTIRIDLCVDYLSDEDCDLENCFDCVDCDDCTDIHKILEETK